MKTNIILSVCLIVKNEEKVLERCLKPLEYFADEIIIVDTGSTDKTIEIASKYTSKIYHFKWNNSFSDARNFSFSKATGKYIMWLDADDVISEENIAKLAQIKPKLQADTYMLKYHTLDEFGSPIFEFFRERIVKNCKKAKWNGFIHETITPFGKIDYLDITITHKKEKNKDPKRNLKIYKYHIKKGIRLNTREQYYYAKELFYNGYYSNCILELKRFLTNTDKFYPNTLDATLTLAKCYELKNKNNMALKTLINSLIEITPTSEYMCEIGDIFLKLGKIRTAIHYYNFALTISPQTNTGQFVNNEYYHFIPKVQLSVCYYSLHEFTIAKKYHDLAKQESPNNKIIMYNEQFFK